MGFINKEEHKIGRLWNTVVDIDWKEMGEGMKMFLILYRS